MLHTVVGKGCILAGIQVSDHVKGLAITGAGVLVLSPDALLLRLLSIDSWTTVMWRSLLMSLVLVAAMTVVERGRPLAAFRSIGRWGLVSSLFYGANATSFVYSIHNTAVANTLVIIACSPLLAAVMSRVFLRERVALETWVATVLVVLGIAVVFWDGLGRGTLDGDIAALATAFFLAGNFTILRFRKHINMIPATALGGFWAALAMLVLGLAAPFSLNEQDVLVMAILGLVVVPLAFGLITIGPRYITAPEVGLLLLLETILGPLWVWLALNERASDTALLAGGFVVATLLVYFTVRLRRQQAPAWVRT